MTAKTARTVQRAIGAGAVAFGLCACGATGPTLQLVDARQAYEHAQMSAAARLTPDQLLTAREALEAAEAAHKSDPGSVQEVHLAYLAQRKAQQAAALGSIAEAKQMQTHASGAYVSSLEKNNERSQSQLQEEHSARIREEQARKEAEERAAQALASLTQVAQVKKEDRGTVLTISGAVLFPEGKSVLSTSARQSLDRVAQALQQQKSENKIRIEGYTDARGPDAANEQLSLARAEAVRAYLVQQGMDSTQLDAVGRGEANPIASNDTAEGRATNRRVEIVIPPEQHASVPPAAGGIVSSAR